jgi:hypothetical protein
LLTRFGRTLVRPICAKIDPTYLGRVAELITVRKHKIAWLSISLLLVACVGFWLWHHFKTRPLASSVVQSRYIEDYSASHPKPVAVVFVHGIRGDDATWGTGDLTLPHLLATDPDLHKQLDLFFFEYDSPWLRNADKIPDLAEELRGRLDENGVWTHHKKVIFVAHSMGGLIVRQFLLSHPDRSQQVQMMYFYAVPTDGAAVANIVRYIWNSPQVDSMITNEFNNYLDGMWHSWRGQKQLSELPTYCAFENQDMLIGRIVPESSARTLCTKSPDPLPGDHEQIVKPRSREDQRFTVLAAAIKESLQADSVTPPAAPTPIKPTVATHPRNPSIPPPSAPTPTGPQAIGAACQQAIEVCSPSELIQRAFIMQQRLKKFADDWREEEDSSRSWAQQMEALHQKTSGGGSSSQFQPLPPGSSQKEKEEFRKRLGFETWISNMRIEVFENNRKKYNDQFRTEAVLIRDEIVNRYPISRTISGYGTYVDLGSYSQVYTVVAHLGACIDALRNKP